jgi:predicted nuclease with RNAse H fold
MLASPTPIPASRRDLMQSDHIARSAHGAVGIDLGADRLHCARLDGTGRLVEARLFVPAELEQLADWISVSRVAIDAPTAPSGGHHREDSAVNRKFRLARCAEIALGAQCGIWVPWVAPLDESVAPDWMSVGFELYRVLRTHDIEAMEVYPHGVFCRLANGRTLPKKTALKGQRVRLALLREAGVDIPIELLTHDGIDAIAAALVAWGPSEGIRCPNYDESRIWLPMPG